MFFMYVIQFTLINYDMMSNYDENINMGLRVRLEIILTKYPIMHTAGFSVTII